MLRRDFSTRQQKKTTKNDGNETGDMHTFIYFTKTIFFLYLLFSPNNVSLDLSQIVNYT